MTYRILDLININSPLVCSVEENIIRLYSFLTTLLMPKAITENVSTLVLLETKHKGGNLPENEINPFMQMCGDMLALKSHSLLVYKVYRSFSPRRKFYRT